MSKGWESSADLGEIAAALASALPELDEIRATNTATVPTKAGGTYSYKYADLAGALGVIRPVLAKHGLVVFQSPHGGRGDVAVSTTLLHRSGQWISSDALSLPAGDTPQTAGSAITYARRYSLLASVGIATEDDDGAHASSAPRQSRATWRDGEDGEGSRNRPAPRHEPESDWRQEYLGTWNKDGLSEDEVCGAASRGTRRQLAQFEDGERGALRVAAARLVAEHKAIKDAAEGSKTSPPAPGEPAHRSSGANSQDGS